MTRGRKPDPTRSRRQTGHREKPGEAKVANAIAIPHDVNAELYAALITSLPESAVGTFDRAIAEVGGRIRDVDLEALCSMAESMHNARELRTYVEEKGRVVETPFGPRVNPALKAIRDETALYLKIANQYGLTLEARLRLGIAELVGQSLLADLNGMLDAPVPAPTTAKKASTGAKRSAAGKAAGTKAPAKKAPAKKTTPGKG